MPAKNNSITSSTIQARFMEQLKAVVPASISLVDEMADLLDLSTDSAYRRIRCETALSIDETVKLCNRFNIPIDTLSIVSDNQVTFSYRSNTELNVYLQSILTDLEAVSRIKNSHIYFAAEDVPLFHHFSFETLTAFKFFYWRKSLLGDCSLEGKKFTTAIISTESVELAKKINRLYTTIPSTEVWTDDTITSTLKQLLFYWEAGLFDNKKDALAVCDEMELMLQHVQTQAEMSGKMTIDKKQPADTNFNFYSSDVMIGSNTVLVDSEGQNMTIISFNTLNTLNTTNKIFFEVNNIWMKNLIKKSILISGVSAKQRFQFFKKGIDAIDRIRKTIDS